MTLGTSTSDCEGARQVRLPSCCKEQENCTVSSKQVFLDIEQQIVQDCDHLENGKKNKTT